MKPMRYASGVLPYARYKGKVLYLLGQESQDLSFCDFGGKSEIADNMSIAQTAVRECFEEQLGLIMPRESMKLRLKYAPCIKSKTKRNLEYQMYVCEIAFQENLRTQFQQVANFLRYCRLGKSLLEKVDLIWVDMDTLLSIKLRDSFHNTIKSHYAFLRNPTMSQNISLVTQGMSGTQIKVTGTDSLRFRNGDPLYTDDLGVLVRNADLLPHKGQTANEKVNALVRLFVAVGALAFMQTRNPKVVALAGGAIYLLTANVSQFERHRVPSRKALSDTEKFAAADCAIQTPTEHPKGQVEHFTEGSSSGPSGTDPTQWFPQIAINRSLQQLPRNPGPVIAQDPAAFARFAYPHKKLLRLNALGEPFASVPVPKPVRQDGVKTIPRMQDLVRL